MCNLNEWIVREAFLAYDRGDVAAMMNFVDPGLDEPSIRARGIRSRRFAMVAGNWRKHCAGRRI